MGSKARESFKGLSKKDIIKKAKSDEKEQNATRNIAEEQRFFSGCTDYLPTLAQIGKVCNAVFTEPRVSTIRMLQCVLTVYEKTSAAIKENTKPFGCTSYAECIRLQNASFASLSTVLIDIMPAYRFGGNVSSGASKETLKQQNYETLLSSFLEKWITFQLKNCILEPNIYVPLLCDAFASHALNIVSDSRLLTLLLKTTSPMFYCHFVSENLVKESRLEEIRQLQLRSLETIAELIASDVSLGQTALLVSALSTLLAQSKGTPSDLKKLRNAVEVSNDCCNSVRIWSSFFSVGTPSWLSQPLLSKLAEIDFLAKQRQAIKEAAAMGITTSQVKDVQRDLHQSCVHGDVRQIQKHEAAILKDLFVLYIRIIRSRESFHLGVVSGALEGIRNYTHLLNLELAMELYREIKLMVVGQKGTHSLAVQKTDWSAEKVHLALRSLICALALLKTGVPQGTSHIAEVDTEWICDAANSAMVQTIPLLRRSSDNHSFGEMLTGNSPKVLLVGEDAAQKKSQVLHSADSHVDLGKQSILADLVHCIEELLTCTFICDRNLSNRTTKRENLILLIYQLLVSAIHADPPIATVFLDQAVKVATKFPEVASAFEPEGHQLSTKSLHQHDHDPKKRKRVAMNSVSSISFYWMVQLYKSHLHAGPRSLGYEGLQQFVDPTESASHYRLFRTS